MSPRRGFRVYASLAMLLRKEPVRSERIWAGWKKQTTVHKDGAPLTASLGAAVGPGPHQSIRKMDHCDPLAPTLTAAKRWHTSL